MRKEYLTGAAENGGEIFLFGVRVKVDPMRKSVSMNNLSQYQHVDGINIGEAKAEAVAVAEDNGYASADDALHNQSSAGAGVRCLKERKRGVPWTEEEHKLFLLGLQKVGKGDWRGISRNFVKTRTPTQVASHAQKYFLRKNNHNRRRRRSSLFDITTDYVYGTPMEECNDQEENLTQHGIATVPMPVAETPSMASNVGVYPFPVTYGQIQNPIESMTFGQVNQADHGSSFHVRPVSLPMSSSSPNEELKMMESTELSLGLSLSSGQGQSLSSSTSTFQLMSSFTNGERIISVA